METFEVKQLFLDIIKMKSILPYTFLEIRKYKWIGHQLIVKTPLGASYPLFSWVEIETPPTSLFMWMIVPSHANVDTHYNGGPKLSPRNNRQQQFPERNLAQCEQCIRRDPDAAGYPGEEQGDLVSWNDDGKNNGEEGGLTTPTPV